MQPILAPRPDGHVDLFDKWTAPPPPDDAGTLPESVEIPASLFDRYLGGVDSVVSSDPAPQPARSDADCAMRRVLRLPEGAPHGSKAAAQQAFSRSVWISAARCLLTYIVLPILGPIVGIAGDVGPVLGLAVGAVSMAAIVASIRRFFATDHRWRWRYTAIGGSILVLLTVQAVIDVADLAG